MKTSNVKLSHTHGCYIHPHICKAMSFPVQLLFPHFPKIRNIRRSIYQLTNFYHRILNLDKALTCANLDTLNNIVVSAQEKAEMYKYQRKDTILNEDDIISKYHNAFKAFKNAQWIYRGIYVCASCEKLSYKRNVSKIDKFKAQIDIPIWRDLIMHLERQKINS